MRILQFVAENFKRIRIVEIVPTKRVTTITGKNGQGKTSVLDALWALFAGKKGIPEKPVRRGAEKSRLRAVIGDDEGKPLLIATRTIATDRTTTLSVEAAPGAERIAGTPQAVLDTLIGQMSFDPIAFVHADSATQVEILRGLVKIEIDIEEENRLIQKEYDERTELKKKVRALQAQADTYIFSPNLPKEKINEEEILGRIQKAGEQNRDIEKIFQAKHALEEKMQAAAKTVADNEATINRARQQLAQLSLDVSAAELVAELSLGIHASFGNFMTALEDLNLPNISGISEDLARIRLKLNDYATEQNEHHDRLEGMLQSTQQLLEASDSIHPQLMIDAAAAKQAYEEAPSGQLIDTQPMLEELGRAQLVNREIARRDRYDEILAELRTNEREAASRTTSMEDREERKRAALASAKMPIDGLTLDEKSVFLRGVPILQLGEAEQIRLGVGLAMASNPKLRAVPIAHGESLDDDSLALIEQMAEENNFQIFMARVDSSGKVGIVLSDGKVESVNE